LVRRGGKIIAVSDLSGDLGPAVSRLRGVDDPASRHEALQHAETDPDHASAVALCEAVDWADVYLLSGLDPADVEDLGILPLARPQEVARLAARLTDVIVINDADRTRVVIEGENP
jgi:hypothetical protein